MDGKSFFYTNAMQVKNSFSHPAMEPERAGWFDCSCCPTNVARLIPSIPGYVYAQQEDNLYVNLFMNNTATLSVHGRPVSITQQNNYPWDGNLKIIITPKQADAFTVRIRIPGWARGEALPSDLYQFATATENKVDVKVNGKPQTYAFEKGYAVLQRTWKRGDVVEVALPMDVQKVVAHEKVTDNIGKVALQRGPLVYCAEWADNDGIASNIMIPAASSFTSEHQPQLLNGVTVLKTKAPVVAVDEKAQNVHTVTKTVTAIPYYAWAHRGRGEMIVWFPTRVKGIDIITKEAAASVQTK
jgi:DUF1680 family protein